MSYSVLLIVDIDVLTTNICIIVFFCFLFLSFSEILHMKFTAHCDPQATFFSIFVALHCIQYYISMCIADENLIFTMFSEVFRGTVLGHGAKIMH